MREVSLYGKYIAERSGMGIVETDDGFATFLYPAEDTVYIVDLYVVPDKRKGGSASQMADAICEEALKVGKKYLLGSVDSGLSTAETSIKVLEAYGMKVHAVTDPMIFYRKRIDGLEEPKEV